MKIKHTVQDKTVLFKDINIMDVFKANNMYYMRIKSIYHDSKLYGNAVGLLDGECDYVFDDLEPVIYLNAELCVDDWWKVR